MKNRGFEVLGDGVQASMLRNNCEPPFKKYSEPISVGPVWSTEKRSL